VITDLATLDSLPAREWKCGFAEIVKYGVIMDEPFFARLEKDAAALLAHDPAVLETVISRCCELKAQVVGLDEKESGLREILNYGHTFGHALETLGGYAAVSHGEAVAIGMRMAARLACQTGRIETAMEARQEALLRQLGLGEPPAAIRALEPAAVLEAMRLDKKSRAGRLRLVLPSCIGHCGTVQGIDETLVRDAIAAILK
jgi:3-dehydroquinate synthase